MASETGDTLTDIHAAVGEMLDAPEVELSDDALDAELDAKHGAIADEPAEIPAEEVEPVAETPIEEPDPLANAKAFEYTVDGQAKTYDGIKVVAGPDGTIQGAVIQPDALKDVQYRLQRGEYLEGQNKALYEKARDFDGITHTNRATGAEVRGMAAVEQYAIENARQGAALKELADVLENPEKLLALAYAIQSGDQSPLQSLTERIALIAENATYKARSEFGQRISQTKEQETQTQDRATVTTNAITNSVHQWAKEIGGLTPDDTQKAITYFQKLGSAIVRPATQDEAKAIQGIKPGELVIDHQVIHEWLQDRAEMRKQAIASTTAASTAAKENAARLARSVGTKAKAPTKATRQTVPADEGETWAQQKARMMAGQFSTED